MDYKLNSTYEEHVVYEFVKSIHHTSDDFVDGDIGERIEQFEHYKLMEVSISQLDRGLYYIDEDLVTDFSKRDYETTPPVVVGGFYGNTFDVIDGNHRVESLVLNGRKNVLAFVPLEFSNNVK